MVTFTVRTDCFSSHSVWELLCEKYDVEVWKQQHTPDGKDLVMELVLHPKGSVPVEKSSKRKKNRKLR